MGIDAYRVDLEVDLARQGMPAFNMVGLAEGAVRESKERVFAALKNTGYSLPPSRVTVNLAPADMRKEGSGYDLPLALGLLASAGVLPPERLEGMYMAGELSLTGEVKPVPGILPLAVRARDDGATGVLVPTGNAPEAAVVDGLPVYAISHLSDAVRFFTGEDSPEPFTHSSSGNGSGEPQERYFEDFSEVKGQEHAKRAIEIAAAGGHNLLFMGPPGSGKSMLARRIPTVLPPLTFEESLEVTKIYSVSGNLQSVTADGEGLIRRRPFRSPHHTISDAGLIGGGHYPRPGEVSLAHRGVLFLDELPEFKKHVLEVMRQPLEDGTVTISRAAVSLSYPAHFMLVAAMNPCPCGYLTDERHPCTCMPMAIRRYRGKLSGPLLDRIDLHVDVPAVPYSDLRERGGGTDSATMRERIARARAIQSARFRDTPCLTNSDLSGRWLDSFCPLGASEHAFLEAAVQRLGLSARAFTRILRIARTIADLEAVIAGKDNTDVTTGHLAEAINYRTLDRQPL